MALTATGTAVPPSSASGRAPRLALTEVSKRFGSTVALRGVTLELDRPGLVALVGVNGSGKTTLLRTAVGLIPPTSGTVRVAGIDPWSHPEQAHRIAGYVPEAPRPYPGMTVNRYLEFVARVCRPAADRAAAVDAAVARFNLGKVLGQRCGALSLGYRQRVALAQADILDAEVLVLDEPMNGLDPRQMTQLRDLLRTWSATRVVILSSHLIAEVQDLAQEVVVLHAGAVLARFDVASVAPGPGERLWAARDLAAEGVDVVLHPPGASAAIVLRWSESAPGAGWEQVAERTSRAPLEDLFLACLALTGDER